MGHVQFLYYVPFFTFVKKWVLNVIKRFFFVLISARILTTIRATQRSEEGMGLTIAMGSKAQTVQKTKKEKPANLQVFP